MRKGKANKTRSSLCAVCGSFHNSATPAIAGKSKVDLAADSGHAHGDKVQCTRSVAAGWTYLAVAGSLEEILQGGGRNPKPGVTIYFLPPLALMTWGGVSMIHRDAVFFVLNHNFPIFSHLNCRQGCLRSQVCFQSRPECVLTFREK